MSTPVPGDPQASEGEILDNVKDDFDSWVRCCGRKNVFKCSTMRCVRCGHEIVFDVKIVGKSEEEEYVRNNLDRVCGHLIHYKESKDGSICKYCSELGEEYCLHTKVILDDIEKILGGFTRRGSMFLCKDDVVITVVCPGVPYGNYLVGINVDVLKVQNSSLFFGNLKTKKHKFIELNDPSSLTKDKLLEIYEGVKT